MIKEVSCGAYLTLSRAGSNPYKTCHASGLAIASERIKPLSFSICAESAPVNCRDPCLPQALFRNCVQVQKIVILSVLCHGGSRIIQNLGEGCSHLRSDFVSLRADGRPQPGEQGLWISPHGMNACADYSGGETTPAGMQRSDTATRAIGQQDRQTICRQNRTNSARVGGELAVRDGTWLLAGRDNADAVFLFQPARLRGQGQALSQALAVCTDSFGSVADMLGLIEARKGRSTITTGTRRGSRRHRSGSRPLRTHEPGGRAQRAAHSEVESCISLASDAINADMSSGGSQVHSHGAPVAGWANDRRHACKA